MGYQVNDNLPALAAGASATFDVVFLVSAGDADNSVLSDTATATATGAASSSASASTTVQGASLQTFVSAPTADPAGDLLTYAITVTNTGLGAAQNVTLTDAPPMGESYVSQTLPAGATGGPYMGYQVQDNLPSLAAGASATFDVVFLISAGDANNSVLTDTATASANGTYSSASASTTVINPLSTTTALTSSADPSTFGQSIMLTATVSSGGQGTPTGTITFMSGTTTLGTGTLSPGGNGSQATLTLSTLAVGNYSIQAVYSGDVTFAASASAALPLTVLQATNISLSVVSANTLASGQAVKLQANVGTTGATWATGTVTFMDGTTVLGTATLSVTSQNFSQATLITSFQTLGAHSVTAIYSGDAANAGSTSAPITLTVRTPVTQYWTDATGDGLASTAANWSGGAFVQGDQLIVDGVFAPHSNDPLNFNVAPTDAYSSPLLASLKIPITYSGRVNFTQCPYFTNIFLDDSGAPVAITAVGTILAPNITLLGANVAGPGGLALAAAGVATIGSGTVLTGMAFTANANSIWTLGTTTFSNDPVVNYGQATWGGGDVALNNGSIITNWGSFLITCDQTMTTVGGGTFSNLGYFEKEVASPLLPPGGQGFTDIQVTFNNAVPTGVTASPSVTVDAHAFLTLSGTGGTDAAPFTVNAGATLDFEAGTQKLYNGTSFTGEGALVVNGAILNIVDGSMVHIDTASTLGTAGAVPFPPSVLDGTSAPGTGAADGTFIVTAAVDWAGGVQLVNTEVILSGSLDLGAGAIGPTPAKLLGSQLWLNGATTWEGTLNIQMSNSTIINGGSFKVANGRAILDGAPPPANAQPTSFFINAGSFTKNAGTAPTTIGVAFINQGTLTFNGTTISFGETLQQTATGAVTDLGGGTMTLTGGNSTFLLSAGELTGAAGATINGSLTNSGLVDFGSAFGGLTITGGYTQTANGTLTINIGAGGQFDSLNISGFANLGGHLQVTGVQSGTSYLILQAGSGGGGAFADVTAPWTALYDTDPVWNVSIQ